MHNRANPFELAICSLLVGFVVSVYILVKLGFNGKAIDHLNKVSPENSICCMDFLDTGFIEK